jgi:hypothetical protein
VEEVAVTTFQSLSGRGDAKYPRDVVMGNVYPLHGTVGHCRLTVSKPVLKARMVSALETKM